MGRKWTGGGREPPRRRPAGRRGAKRPGQSRRRRTARAGEPTRLGEERRRLRAAAEVAAHERERLVADLRRTLRERDESAAVLDAFFDNAPVGLALVDPQLRIVRVNPALAAMNGLTVAQHLGRTVPEVLPGLPVEELARGVAHILATRQPLTDVEVEGQTPPVPGERQRFVESWYPVAVGERVIGVGALVRDVTAERRAAEFQRQVLAVVGHDLRSPLLAITASVAMLLHGEPLPDRSARAVRRILSAATRIDGIARALADYARVQVGRGIPLERRPVDFREVAREVAAEVEAAHPGRTVRCRVPEPEPGEWDPDRLGQVVANLLGNALEHGTPDGPVALACGGDRGTLVFEVSNRGPPIPSEFRPLLFEPFRRGPGAERNGRGLGLGLFIARQIVLAHGGALEVRSDEAQGTAFTVRLPRRAAGAPP